MKKNIKIQAALSAFLLGLCMIRPLVPACAAEMGVTSTGSIVYENGTDSVALYAEDIACLKETLDSVRAVTYSPDVYACGSLPPVSVAEDIPDVGKAPILPEGAETEVPALQESAETEDPAFPEDAETEPPTLPEDAETEVPDLPEGAETEPPVLPKGAEAEAPAPQEDTETETPAPQEDSSEEEGENE